MAPWLAFALVVAAKKAITFALWKAGSRYGWPRVYRRLLEYSNRVSPVEARPVIRTALKTSLRFPSRALEAYKGKEVQDFIDRIEHSKFAKGYHPYAGLSLSALIKTVRALPESFLQDLAKGAAAQEEAEKEKAHGSASSTAAKTASGDGGSGEAQLK